MIVETFGLAFYRMSIDQRAMGAIVCIRAVFEIFWEDSMARSSDNPQNKRRGKKALGVMGVSLSLAGAACVDSSPADASTAPTTGRTRTIDLREQEVFDVGLNSFRLFDREEVPAVKTEQVAWWWGGCRGCRGCGCRGCRGCGCRGCGCRGCG
ncbi:hypothetical protein [Methylocystis rosea]|uniref:Uncharacterized protein n=1 Tax=Methylocystis rosea TaxID=173366 RepID=A0A3G8M0H8_9HYPH|nr:hypothetical protein [Methylocystis rosea]AZG75449.1 hypothetical protein EHO51_01065 [Methylocystis rosea]